MSGTVLFLGAGATKSVQGPMTDEILPAMFTEMSLIANSDPKGRVAKLMHFLESEFHINSGLPKEQYPGLPLLMSLIDMALDRRELFDAEWDGKQVITTNYNLIADTTLMHMSQQRQPPGGLPNYHCGIANISPWDPSRSLEHSSSCMDR